MKIAFVRSGGFAGTRLSLNVDTDDLPAEEAARLLERIQEALADLRAVRRTHPSPDGFVYQLSLDSSHAGREDLTLCEPDVPQAARPLIEQLTAMARGARA